MHDDKSDKIEGSMKKDDQFPKVPEVFREERKTKKKAK